MVKVYSPQVAIPASLTFLGFAISAYYEKDIDLSIGLFVGAITCFVVFLVFRRQRVDIGILTCVLYPESTEQLTMTLEGFIHSRHTDGLNGIELWLHPAVSLIPSSSSNVPQSVGANPQKFTVCFNITYSFLNQAMEEQQTDGVNFAWLLSANMLSADWLYTGFIISVGFIKNGQIGGLKMSGRVRKTTKKRKEGMGINKKQFHELLKKASQSIKKPDAK